MHLTDIRRTLCRMKPRLAQTAADQHGVFTKSDVIRHGHTAAQLRGYLARGDWVRRGRGTYMTAGTPLTQQARREIARQSLPCDFAFSHLTAAQIWGLKAPPPTSVDVVIHDRHRIRSDYFVVRRVRGRMLRRRRFRKGVWVTDIETTILHCAAILSYDDLVTLVEDALRRGLTTLSRLRARLGRGLSGSAALRALLEELDDGFRDRWTRRLARRLIQRGAPLPEYEPPIVDPRTGRVIKPDLAWRALGVLGEVDDWSTHGDRSAQERDRARDRWLFATYGYIVVRTTPREIRRNIDRVVDDFLAALDRAARAKAAVA
jgi:predicted transcriptional regulator of viral defense system